MQFGIFSSADVTTDPTTGGTPSDQERGKAMVRLAEHAEDVGLDVFAAGEHDTAPLVPSAPTTLGYIAARTSRLTLTTSTRPNRTDYPVKVPEDCLTLQHLADGRDAQVTDDLPARLGRGRREDGRDLRDENGRRHVRSSRGCWAC